MVIELRSDALPGCTDIDPLRELAEHALTETGAPACPRYIETLGDGLWHEPPPCGTRMYEMMYRTAAADPQWMAMSLISGADRDGRRSRSIWRLASASTDDGEREQLRAHAVDESRHALANVALLDLAFPGAIDDVFRAQLENLAPRYDIDTSPTGEVSQPRPGRTPFDELVLLNLAELRAALLQTLQHPMLMEHCEIANLARANDELRGLLSDELRHIASTARRIEGYMADLAPVKVRARFQTLMRAFNDSCAEEQIDYSYNERFGTYP
jgi:hypothetical protein